ncbi:uncharacterized protein [Linepithema humile]|uniref:uncharacterized protein n=1 Tax=Linepithema humile TaxID=83485 RepID=UPI00351F71D1
MSTKLLQANLNHARRAQDLFLSDLCKRDAGLGVAAEPYRVLDSDPNWVSASNGSVVIWNGGGIRYGAVGCLLRDKGLCPSRRPHLEFLEQLQEMREGIRRCLPHPVLVAGDFNAWHQEWGSRLTNIRGEAVRDWAAGLGLLLQNRGLRPAAPPISETLDPEFLGQVVGKLFPIRDIHIPLEGIPPWTGDLEISERELSEASKRLGATGKAPGPDGVPGRVWALAFGVVGARLRRMLLCKEGKPAEQPSAYRPICLLDEVGKLFERIVASRIVQHLSRDDPNLSEDQFGFRESRSTTDAIMHLRALSEHIVGERDVALAVLLDIVNAFNSLPWEHVGEAMEFYGLPPYIREVLWDYFRDRTLQLKDQLERSAPHGASPGLSSAVLRGRHTGGSPGEDMEGSPGCGKCYPGGCVLYQSNGARDRPTKNGGFVLLRQGLGTASTYPDLGRGSPCPDENPDEISGPHPG